MCEICGRKLCIPAHPGFIICILLQGYTFFEAGKFVTILLDGKGLKKLVTDDLVDNIVFILNLAIACLTGFAGCFLSSSDNHYATMLDIYNHPYFGPIAAGFS